MPPRIFSYGIAFLELLLTKVHTRLLSLSPCIQFGKGTRVYHKSMIRSTVGGG